MSFLSKIFVGFVLVLLPFFSYGTNLMSLLISSVLVLVGLFFLNYKKKVTVQGFDWFLIAFLFLFNLSFIFSLVPYGFKEFVTFNIGALIYFSIGNLAEFNAKNSWMRQLGVVLLVGFNIVNSYFLYLYGFSSLDRFGSFFVGDESYMVYPNVLATLLLLVIPAQYYLYRKFDFKSQRGLNEIFLVGLLLSLLSFWLTFSRGAVVAFCGVLILALVVMVVQRVRFKKSILLFKELILVGLILGVTFAGAMLMVEAKTYNLSYVDRFGMQNDVSAQKSLDERLVFFRNAVLISLDNPVFGTGPGSFQFVNPAYQTESLVNSEHPHNLFLKIALESGILAGILFFMWIAGVLIVGLFKLFKGKLSGFQVVAFFAVVGVTVSSLVDYNLGFPVIAFLYFGFLGVLRESTFFGTKNVLSLKWLIVIVLVFVFYQGGLFYLAKDANKSLEPIVLNGLGFHNDYVVNFYDGEGDYLDKQRFLKAYAQRYESFAPAQLALGKAAELVDVRIGALNRYLELDRFNSFEPYLLLLQLDSSKVELEKLFVLLVRYNQLLAVNSHLTVVTENPRFVYQIYMFLLESEVASPEIEVAFNDFQQILFAEQVKFDTRYKTTLADNFLEWINSNY